MMRFWILDFEFWIKGAKPRPRSASAYAIQNPKSKIQNSPAGFTLLEVILALVVLAAGLAMLGEVTELAGRHALEARAETQAQSLATSIMDQLMAGVIEREAASRQPLEVDDDTPWLYSVNIGTSEITGIAPVEVIVEQDLEPQMAPVKFRLLRWMPTTLELPESASGGAAGGQGQSGQGTGGGAGGGQGPPPGGAGGATP